MLENNTKDLHKGIDVDKTDGLYECIIYHYQRFIEISFKFQPKI